MPVIARPYDINVEHNTISHLLLGEPSSELADGQNRQLAACQPIILSTDLNDYLLPGEPSSELADGQNNYPSSAK